MKKTLSRRSFVKQVGAAGITMGIAGIGLKAAETKPAPDTALAKIRNFKPTMAYRDIGATGIKVSVFSMGTGNVKPDVLSAAMDMGVNFVHASFHYMNGQSLEMVGKAIKGKTDKVYIALKDDFPSIEEALKVLGVSSVDFLMFNRHNAGDLKKELPSIKTSLTPGATKDWSNSRASPCTKTLPRCLMLPPTPGFLPASCPRIRRNRLRNSRPNAAIAREKHLPSRHEIKGGVKRRGLRGTHTAGPGRHYRKHDHQGGGSLDELSRGAPRPSRPEPACCTVS